MKQGFKLARMASPESFNRSSRVEKNVDNEAFGARSWSTRNKKSKNGPKKVPQRGLGVAKLEKLRLQEQKLQETAGFAATRGLQAFPLSSGVVLSEPGSLYGCPYSSLDGTLEVCNNKRGKNLFSLCKLLPSSDETLPLSTGLALPDKRKLMFQTCNDKASVCADLISASTFNQPVVSPPVIVVPEHAEGNDVTPSSFSRAVDTSSLDSSLCSSISITDHPNGDSTICQKESSVVRVAGVDAAKISSLSSIDVLSSLAKSTTTNGVLNGGFTSQLVVSQLQCAAKMNKNSGQDKNKLEHLPFLYPTGKKFTNVANTGLMKASALCNCEGNGGGSLLNLRPLNSAFEPPDKHHLAVDQLRLPTMGISAFGETPKELSSIQNCSRSQVRASADKPSEKKRPWLAMEHPTLLDIKLKDRAVPGSQGSDEHLKHQIFPAQPLDCKGICSSSGRILWIPPFPSGSCPDQFLSLDAMGSTGRQNFSSNCDDGMMNSVLQTTPSSFLSLATLSPTEKGFYPQNLGYEHFFSQNDFPELKKATSQKETADKRKASSSLTDELEGCQTGELSRSVVSWKNQSLDLRLKLAL